MGGPEPAASPRRAPVTLCPPSEPTMLGSGCTEGQRAGIEDLEAPRWRRDGDDPISSLFDTHGDDPISSLFDGISARCASVLRRATPSRHHPHPAPLFGTTPF